MSRRNSGYFVSHPVNILILLPNNGRMGRWIGLIERGGRAPRSASRRSGIRCACGLLRRRKENPARAESLRWILRQVIAEFGTQEGKA